MRARWVAAVVLLLGLGGLLLLYDPPTDRTTAAVGDGDDTPRAPGAAAASGPTSDDTGSQRRMSDVVAQLRARTSRVSPEPSSAQARAAAGALALFNDFDLEAAADVFEKPSAGLEEWVEWLRARLGRCEAGEVLAIRDDRVRYVHPCERGRLELEFGLGPDSGKIAAVMMGARDVELAGPVREAAEAVMRLYAAWDPALFARTFSDKFVAEAMRRFLLDVRAQYGACSLGGPDLVSVRGALIALRCDNGEPVMKVELRQDDDRIRTMSIRAAATP